MEDLTEKKGPSLPIRILNHENGETVSFPLVLLEGCLNDVQSSSYTRSKISIFSKSDGPGDESGDEDRAVKVHILETTSTDGEILIECQDKRWRWPVVCGGFKALVPLRIGENILTMRSVNEDGAIKLKLNYAPLPLSRYVHRIRILVKL